MLKGCYTALITPFGEDEMDREGLEQLVAFQIKNGTRGILAVGTTGESPVLDWREHNEVTQMVCRLCKGHCTAIAGTGSNCTRESLEATGHAVGCGAEAVLLVDPYYNGPSSLEIRREYVAPIANAFPEVEVIPYVIPGRSGTQLLPEDLAMLHAACPNVGTVKEATGDMDNMVRTREVCGEDFVILSGDDDKTFDMMSDPDIRAGGVISVTSNIAPRAVQQMTELLNAGERKKAERVMHALKPLFEIVTVKTEEQTPYGPVTCRARNPLAVKTLMNVLGMPSGPCRPPLGKLTRKGLYAVLEAARMVQKNAPDILAPIAEFFHVDVEERLNEEACWRGLYYEGY